MKSRKLVRFDVLSKVADDVILGIPLTRSMRQRNVTGITRPTVAKLVVCYNEMIAAMRTEGLNEANVIFNSLDPAWLDDNGPIVQESNIPYSGEFPAGEWNEND